MPKCKYDYKPKIWESIPPEIPLDCKEEHTKNSEFCIFHDKNYFEGHEQEAAKRFEEKVKEDSINQNEPLVCFGYYLPYINFASLLKRKRFAQPVYFNEATFSKKANFSEATFAERADFGFATFSKEVTFVGFDKAGEPSQWLEAFERSFADFLPLLSLGGDIKVGVIDYIIKIVGGALTFGLLLIAFRRKFERKYTR